MRPSLPVVDFVMSSPSRLQTAAQRLRDAGYPDALESNRQADEPGHVLSVSTDVGCHMQVAWIVTRADPESRPL